MEVNKSWDAIKQARVQRGMKVGAAVVKGLAALVSVAVLAVLVVFAFPAVATFTGLTAVTAMISASALVSLASASKVLLLVVAGVILIKLVVTIVRDSRSDTNLENTRIGSRQSFSQASSGDAVWYVKEEDLPSCSEDDSQYSQ